MRADAIFFDVDGTLVDSREGIAAAMNHVLRELGRKQKPVWLIASYVGTGVRDLVDKSLDDGKSALVEKAVSLFSDYYLKHPTDRSRLYPHVKETLEYFKRKRKFIVTNRYEKFAEATLKGFGIRKYFEAIIGGDDENCLKPSACILDSILIKSKLAKDRVIIVGDMTIDVETGRNSGVKTCWVTYGLGKRKDVEPMKPDYIIDDMAELKSIIE
jgi:phosphoglycolate phosphatase